MIEAVLRVLDRLIQLRQYRAERLRKQFDLVVEPIVDDVQHIHSDYLEMFLQARALLADRHQGADEVAEFLEQKRTEFEPVRDKLLAQASAFQSLDLPEQIGAFNSAVLAYLPVGELGFGRGTAGTTLIRQLRRIAGQTTPRAGFDDNWEELSSALGREAPDRRPPFSDDPVECIDGFVELQRARWRRVCETAAAVRAAVVAAE